MGFYGNITNINKTQFTFDKIYPNRVTMDKEANRDGIYVGRYVLVDYDKGSNYQEKYQRVYTNDEIHFYFTEDLTEESQARYLEDENRRDPVSHLYYISKNQIVYVIFQNKIKYYICNGEIQGTGLPELIEITNNFEDKDIYLQNYFEDINKYPDMGRGYDSTVWQKVYVDGKEKYAMIAELNSVVPTFDVTVDAPTINPIQPHFDIDSTDVYYKLHLQPSWGFRVAQKNEEFKSDEVVEEYESWDWDSIGEKKIPVTHQPYPGAIYYNKKGFNAERHYIEPENEEKINCIKITPGQSGAKYNTHDNNGYIQKEAADDLQELSIQLPTIGDTISQIWDIVYGIDEGISEIIDETRENRYFPRNTNLDWNSTLGTRLIREKTDGSGFEYDTENLKTVAGCINSIHDLMGRIIANENENTTAEEIENKLNTALSNYIYYGNYNKDNLNYKSYFIKEPYFEIVEDKDSELIPEPINNLKDFNANNYYYTHSDNYYLETTGYHSGNVYYILDVNPDKQELIQYLPNIYYYQDEYKNFILSTVAVPDKSKEYYSANEIINPLVTINYNKGQIFAPTSQSYFENTDIFAFSDSNINSKDNKGWFYLDRIDNVRKPLKAALTQEQIAAGKGSEQLQPLELLYSTGFRMEKGWDPIKSEIVQTYEFDKQGTSNVLYTEGNNLYFYAENTYYYLEDVIDEQGNLILDDKGNPKKNYKLLNNQDDILLDREYIAFGGANDASKFTKIEKKFYTPNLYYYKEGSDYILAKEETYYENKEYYIMNSEPQAITDIVFYEPNKYYYWNKYQQDYIIDKNKTITLFEDEEQTIPRKYFKEGQLHWYILEDEKGILPVGSRLNLNLIKDNKELPEGLKVGVREERYKWTELTGFARTLNTVHGLILELNRLIKFDDVTTRDSSTIQGCINLINDIIAQFGKLTPGELVVVDSYGRMTSAKPNSVEVAVEDRKLKYNYSTEIFEEIQNNNEINQGWIGFDITDKENLTVDIGFGHKYNGRIDENDDLINPETIQVDMNNQQGDTIGLISPIIDNTGHVVAFNTEQVTLPYGFKTFKAENNNKTEAPNMNIQDEGQIADNTQDEFNFKASNKWIRLDNKTEEDSLLIGHELSPIADQAGIQFGLSEDLNIENLDKENQFTIPNFKFDEAGHIVEAATKSVSLPESFNTIKIKSNFDKEEVYNIEADMMQDTVSFSAGNKWIELPTNIENDEIQIQHYIFPFSESINTIDLNNEKEFKVQEINWDDAGHLISSQKTTFTLPYNFKTINVNNNGNTATTLSESVTSGELEAKTPIDNFTLDTGNKWIQFNSDTNAKTITISHGPAGEASILQSENIVDNSPSFGGSIKVPYIDYDEAGHIKSSGIRTIILPSGELEKNEDGNVLIGLEFESSTGKISEIKENIGNLVLIGYTDNLDDSQINDSDTVINAFSKLQNQIENLQIDIGGKSVAEQISQAIEAENLSQYALNSELAILTGKIGSIETKITDEKIAQWDKGETNIQVDWNEEDNTSDAYILNKPNIAELIQRIVALETKVQELEKYHITETPEEVPIE